MDGFGLCYLPRLVPLLSLFLTGCVGLHHHLQKRSEKAHAEPPTISVTGMVTKPGPIALNHTDATLREAVLSAGGSTPDRAFGVDPMSVLVSLERGFGINSFSLPLVLRDEAGKILLRPGDKVTVQLWHETDLSRAAKLEIDPDDEKAPPKWYANKTAIKQIFGHDSDTKKTVNYAVPFTVDNSPRPAISGSVDVPPDDSAIPFRLIRFDTAPDNRDREQTVISLKRSHKGRALEFVLLRTTPPYLENKLDVAPSVPKEIMRSIMVLPGDSVAISNLRTHPLVVASLIAPLLQNTSVTRTVEHEHLPRVHYAIDKSCNTVKRVTAPARQAFGQVEAVVAPPLQAVCDTLTAPLR